ncbi:hypothetical protein Acr_12g0001550 [Actinidia rufa]|uniref:Uncharacterized protein n=1 Tax=Actinidia rufa TaxID=165716 RepID=A0A7J0FFY7_9ERIC|nr:hypothetical protein Acr_12g0001550 [Actinidia rufa]
MVAVLVETMVAVLEETMAVVAVEIVAVVTEEGIAVTDAAAAITMEGAIGAALILVRPWTRKLKANLTTDEQTLICAIYPILPCRD